jgi:hypothetical protein
MLISSADNASTDFGDAAVTPAGDLIASAVGGTLYLQRIRGGARVQVASGDVKNPRWRADGHELYYLANGHLMAATVTGVDPIHVGSPHALLEFGGSLYWPSQDGQRFLAAVPQTAGVQSGIGVVLNWTGLVDK